MRRSIIALAAAASWYLPTAADAAVYNFTFTPSQQLFGSTAFSGTGTFTTSDTAMQVGGQTAFTILSISGTVNGSAIVAPTNSAGYGNFFTTGPTFLDGTGLRFFTQGGNDVRFFYQDTVGQYRVNTFSPGTSEYVTASASLVAGVPEPSTWVMMILGFCGLAYLGYSRKRLVPVTVAAAV